MLTFLLLFVIVFCFSFVVGMEVEEPQTAEASGAKNSAGIFESVTCFYFYGFVFLMPCGTAAHSLLGGEFIILLVDMGNACLMSSQESRNRWLTVLTTPSCSIGGSK